MSWLALCCDWRWKASAIPFDCPMERWTDWYPQLPGARRADRSSCRVLTEWGPEVILRGSNPQGRMSALGQKQTSAHVRVMSALPPKADIGTQSWNVRFVPKADIRTALSVVVGAGGFIAARRNFAAENRFSRRLQWPECEPNSKRQW